MTIDVENTRAQIAQAPRTEVQGILARVYAALAAGEIDEDTAAALDDAGRVRQGRSDTGSAVRPVRGSATVDAIRAARRPVGSRPRSPDSLARRRRWAASGRLPPAIASQFTCAEQAALAVITAEVAQRGRCVLYLDHIAALAGVCRSTVKNAVREGRRLGLLTIEERKSASGWRNDSNIIQIVSPVWQAWMRLVRRSGRSGQASAVKTVPTTHTGFIESGKTGKTEPSKRLPKGSERPYPMRSGENPRRR